MATLARFERDFTDDAGNLLTGNVTVEVRRMSGGLPQLYSDRAGASALGNPFINDGGRIAFHAEGNSYRVTVTQGAYSRELTYVAIGLAGESDFTFAVNQGEWVDDFSYARGDYTVRNSVGIFISTQDSNLNHQPDDTTPASTAYWTYYPGLVGPAGPAGSGMNWRGSWITDTAFAIADGVAEGGSSYICLVPHTSGVFATDLAAAKWELFAAKGDTGSAGAAGANGSDGADPGVLLTWDVANDDSDPGAGKIKADNDALGSATMLYIDKANRAGSDIAAFLLALDDSTNTAKGTLSLTDPVTEAQAVWTVTGVTDATGYVKVAISGHSGATAFADTTPVSLQFSRAGDKGADGADGANGADGYTPGYRLTFDVTTTDSDPGAGKVRFNHATFGSITSVFVDNVDAGAVSLTTWLDGLDDVLNANARAYLRFQKATDPTIYAEFAVTGAVTDGTGYRKIPVSPIAGAVPADATVLVATAAKSGADGAGGVDSVNGQTGTVVLDADDIDDAATTNKFATAGQLAKVDYLTVTQAVDLDAIETRVNALDAAVILMGGWDASAGTFPGGGTAQAGASYQITVAGTVDGIAFSVNDRIIALTDNASTTTYVSNWLKADYSDLITSVDGATGAVTVGAIIAAATGKTTPVDADSLALSDSAASNATKKLTWADLKATLKSYFDSLTTTLTNKRITARVTSITSSATPTVNTDNTDVVDITALAVAITSMTTNLSGTPNIGDTLIYQIKDDGTARAITWGASFAAMGVALPTTTVISKRLTVGFMWNGTNWGCVGSAQEA